MPPKPRPEGLAIVLIQVLVALLTLITVVPLFAVFEFQDGTNGLAAGVIVFGAWLLVVSIVVPLVQKRARGTERVP